MTDSRSSDKPTLAAVIREAIKSETGEMQTNAVGEILSYDADKQTCSVQVSIQNRVQDLESEGFIFEIPDPVNSVPVVWPQGSTANATFADSKPLKRGDKVAILFAGRSLDEWIASGRSGIIPADPRRFDPSDAIAVPGLRPLSDPIPNLPADRAHYGDPAGFRLSIADNGRGKLGTSTNDLFEIVSSNLGTQVTIYNALGTVFGALATAWTAVGTWATAAEAKWPDPDPFGIASAAMVAAAGTAATACTTAQGACTTAAGNATTQKANVDAIKG